MKKQKQLLKVSSFSAQALHKSHVTSGLKRLVSSKDIHHSFINSNDEKLSEISNNYAKKSFKYERVNNMFKLVEVKSSDEEE